MGRVRGSEHPFPTHLVGRKRYNSLATVFTNISRGFAPEINVCLTLTIKKKKKREKIKSVCFENNEATKESWDFKVSPGPGDLIWIVMPEGRYTGKGILNN